MLAKERVIERDLRTIKLPHDTNGRYLRVVSIMVKILLTTTKRKNDS